MRGTELLRCRVVDSAGVDCGPVRDVRLVRTADGRFRVSGLVIGGGRLARLAHATGATDGRVAGPAPLRWLLRDAVDKARYVAASEVVDWGSEVVRIAARGESLPPFRGEEAGQ